MMFARQHSIAVDYPVSRYLGFYPVTAVHGPANHAGRGFGAKRCGNSAIRSNTSFRDLACHFVHQGKEIVI